MPTARELGLGEADDTTWVVFFVPAKTPDAVIGKINADVNAILKDKDTQDQLDKIGFMAVGGSAKDAESYVQSETRRWGEIIRKIGLGSEIGQGMYNAGSPRRHRSQDRTARPPSPIDEISKDVVNPRQGCTFFNIWSTALPADNNDDSDGAKEIIGTAMKDRAVFRVIEYAPGVTPRNHRTNSIDFAVVMSGEIDMDARRRGRASQGRRRAWSSAAPSTTGSTTATSPA